MVNIFSCLLYHSTRLQIDRQTETLFLSWIIWEQVADSIIFWPYILQFCSAQPISVAQSCLTLCNLMDYSMPVFPVHHQLLELAQTHVHWVSDAIQPSHPLLSPSPPALNLSQCQVFSNESALCIRWPKYWNFSFNISPFNEHPGLISFRMDWLDLLAVQGTLKSLLQHHSSKASILWCSASYTVQLSHPYKITGKTIPLTRWTFVDKAISLLFMLSRLVITFLPRCKCLLISWLQSPSAVILEPRKIKSATLLIANFKSDPASVTGINWTVCSSNPCCARVNCI